SFVRLRTNGTKRISVMIATSRPARRPPLPSEPSLATREPLRAPEFLVGGDTLPKSFVSHALLCSDTLVSRWGNVIRESHAGLRGKGCDELPHRGNDRARQGPVESRHFVRQPEACPESPRGSGRDRRISRPAGK